MLNGGAKPRISQLGISRVLRPMKDCIAVGALKLLYYLLCCHGSFYDSLKLEEIMNSAYRLTDKNIIEFTFIQKKLKKYLRSTEFYMVFLDKLKYSFRA